MKKQAGFLERFKQLIDDKKKNVDEQSFKIELKGDRKNNS